jgi:L-alanine-DL-glutamate epimerase-like enolase superfamily enzyme
VKIVDVVARPIRNTDLDRPAAGASPGEPTAARAEPVALVVVEVLTGEPRATGGQVDLLEQPGFGTTIDRAQVDRLAAPPGGW